MTLFPEMVESGLKTSIIGRACEAGIITIETVNIRDFTKDIHRHVDDYPYGGGAGMVMQAQPVYDCFQSIMKSISLREVEPSQPELRQTEPGQSEPSQSELSQPELCRSVSSEADFCRSELSQSMSGQVENGKKIRVLYTSPAGRVFDQQMARELAESDDIIILCGHYEGVDERALQLIGAEDVSIGDYVLTGGELPAMVMVDAVSRMVPGVLTNEQSGEDESFSSVNPSAEFTRKARREVYGDLASREELMLLEYPQYTRPEEFMGMRVPEVLLSGHHDNIEKWRRRQSLERTRSRRPDLLNQ